MQQGQAAFKGSLLPAKGKGKQKAAGKQSSKSRPAADAVSDDDQDDVLQDYELSDDSDMED